MVDTIKIVKSVLDEVIASGNVPRAVRANTISGPLCRYIRSKWFHDRVQVGDLTQELIDNIEKPTEKQQTDFVSNMARMTFGRYILQEDSKEYKEIKNKFETKYEKTIFDLVNYVRGFTQTKFVLDIKVFKTWWAAIESRPATKVVEQWFLNGVTSATDSEDLMDIFDRIQYIVSIKDTVPVVAELIKLLPYADTDSDLDSYRDPFQDSDEEADSDGSSGDGESGIGYSAAPPDPAKESTRERKFKKSPTPSEVSGKGMIDFFSKGLFDTKRRLTDKDAGRVAEVQKIIEPIFEAKTLLLATKEPQPRLDRRSIGLAKIHKSFTFAEPATMSRGCVNMSIIFDCSGSMGSAVQDGRIFLHALNNMALKGYVKGYVYFSSGEGYMVKKFPMDETEIANVSAFSGSEGIESVLREQVAMLKKSQLICCYTDACITDRKWSKEFYEAQGIAPVGLYVGGEGARTEMEKFFSKNHIQPTVEDLSYGLLDYIKATPMAVKR